MAVVATPGKRSRILLIVLAVAAVLGVLAFIGSRTGGNGGGGEEAALAAIGMKAGAAGCTPVEDVPATGASEHVSGRVDYDRAPPASGRHAPNWMPAGRRFYPRADAPPVERLVHNLEHGYVVVWYDATATDAQIRELEQAAQEAKTRKLIVAPWDRGTFPDGRPIVLTAWGHARGCAQVSGEAIAEFVTEYGGSNGDAPEPNAP